MVDGSATAKREKPPSPIYLKHISNPNTIVVVYLFLLEIRAKYIWSSRYIILVHLTRCDMITPPSAILLPTLSFIIETIGAGRPCTQQPRDTVSVKRDKYTSGTEGLISAVSVTHGLHEL